MKGKFVRQPKAQLKIRRCLSERRPCNARIKVIDREGFYCCRYGWCDFALPVSGRRND